MLNALHRLPALETAEVKLLLNGPESFTPDGSFLLGETSETRGLFLGCGMNSVGVATGGGAGMALAHCIQHGHTPTDLNEVDPKRFAPEFNSVNALTTRVPEVLGKHYEITYPGRQWSTSRDLKKSPLDEMWEKEKPHFGQIGSWERPLYFGKTKNSELTFCRPSWHENIRREVQAAHEEAAIFDQSTFGKIDVIGKDASSFLNRVCANQMNRPIGKTIYTALLNERAGFESDLTAVRISDNFYRLYTGTTAIKRDLAWLTRHIKIGEDIRLEDVTDTYAVIGLMGPQAEAVALSIGSCALNEIAYFSSAEVELAGHIVRGARLSYVGEAGWEITCRSEHSRDIYNAISAVGVRSAGLWAQTSMRIEKRFLAYGYELDTDISPAEVGLNFAVDINKEFIGKNALQEKLEAGAENRIISIVLDDNEGVPLGNEPVLYDGKIVGKTTSATFGFRINAPIAIADILVPECRIDGTSVEINIAGKLFRGRVLTEAAFDPKGKRMKPKK